MKRVGITCLCVLIALSSALWAVLYFDKPPQEKQLIAEFRSHQPDYERLRDMLKQDKNVLRVAKWGVETRKSTLPHERTDEDLSLSRYQDYVALLKRVGGKWATRGVNDANVSIEVWAWGFAGNTRHLDVCWIEHPPLNEIASLDEYYRDPKRKHDAYRHIEGDWYLWTDW